jgi:hypothetical protein
LLDVEAEAPVGRRLRPLMAAAAAAAAARLCFERLRATKLRTSTWGLLGLSPFLGPAHF